MSVGETDGKWERRRKKEKRDFAVSVELLGCCVPGWGGWEWGHRDVGSQTAAMPARAVRGEKGVVAAGLAAARLSCHPVPLGTESARDTAR